MNDALFKICIFGDGGVGKTTLVNKYLTGIFKADQTITIGVDFHIVWQGVFHVNNGFGHRLYYR